MEIKTILTEQYAVRNAIYLDVDGMLLFGGFMKDQCEVLYPDELLLMPASETTSRITTIDGVPVLLVVNAGTDNGSETYISLMPCIQINETQSVPIVLTDYPYALANENPEFAMYLRERLKTNYNYILNLYNQQIEQGNYSNIIHQSTIDEYRAANLFTTGLHEHVFMANVFEMHSVYNSENPPVTSENIETDTLAAFTGVTPSAPNEPSVIVPPLETEVNSNFESDGVYENDKPFDLSESDSRVVQSTSDAPVAVVEFNDEPYDDDLYKPVDAMDFSKIHSMKSVTSADGKKVLDFEFIRRPVPDNGGEIDYTQGLFVPRGTVADNAAANVLMNTIAFKIGVPMSKSMVRERIENVSSRLAEISRDVLKPFFGVDFIDYSSRTNHPEHIAVLYCKAFPFYVERSQHFGKTGYISFTEPQLSKYKDKLELMLERGECSPSERDSIEQCLNITNHIIEHKFLTAVESQFKSIKIIISERCPRSPSEIISKDSNIWATPDVNDDDIMWVHPTIGTTNTFRCTTSDPNMQGMNVMLKECIKAPKGYSIFTIDISAQDVYPLICEVLANRQIMERTRETNDPYMAILEELGYEKTAKNKSACKVPTLSVINGQSRWTTEKDAAEQGHDVDMVCRIYDFINNDPGYKRVKDGATEEAGREVSYRRGLFGSEKIIDKRIEDKKTKRLLTGKTLEAAVARRILNGPFQITSAELLTVSYMTMMYDLINERTPGISIREICPLLPIHDELVGMVKDEVDDDGENIYTNVIRHYTLVHVENWVRMSGKHKIARHYEGK